VSVFARHLLLPYLIWILYATYLNAGIVALN
jgi:tryptophan-rich sensory protein